MSKKIAGLTITFIFSLLLVIAAYSHDIWLYPNQFILSKGDTLIVRQLAGSELAIEMEIELLTRMTPSYVLITPTESIDLLSELPDMFQWVKPVLKRKLDFDGLALVTMEHAFIWNEFSNEKFLEYLEHEELKLEKFQDQIGNKPKQTERYARTLKCLVQVGDASDGDLHKQVVGQKLEILLLQNPYFLEPGDDLEVQVLFDGKPLADQLVTAFSGDGKQLVSTSKAHTNEAGIARFKLDRKRFWLLRLVHLYPCSDPDVDWESYWTSYSFWVN
ncbi:MAG: DUF4198 domain-containing protein [Verrucomicrobia bacterium]|nr:DUF4198 domain-containing protein [Verrucomicrobiota bacterium]